MAASSYPHAGEAGCEGVANNRRPCCASERRDRHRSRDRYRARRRQSRRRAVRHAAGRGNEGRDRCVFVPTPGPPGSAAVGQ